MMAPAESNAMSTADRVPARETFTYWRESDGHFLGYLNAYPDQLLDLYHEFSKEDLPGIRKIGALVVA